MRLDTLTGPVTLRTLVGITLGSQKPSPLQLPILDNGKSHHVRAGVAKRSLTVSACTDTIMTEMQHDERHARRVQAGDDRKRPHSTLDDERDAVRPRAMQEDDVENHLSSAEPSGDENRHQ